MLVLVLVLGLVLGLGPLGLQRLLLPLLLALVMSRALATRRFETDPRPKGLVRWNLAEKHGHL